MTQGSVKPNRLWNINFLLLWQGQFVSSMGDVVYEIALGFWVLAVPQTLQWTQQSPWRAMIQRNRAAEEY